MYSTILLFFTLLIPSLASLTPVSTTQSTLLSFGAAHTTQTYLLSTSSDTITSVTVESPTKTPRKILSRFETTHVQLEKGVHNITVDLFFESWVGNVDYAVVVNTVNAGRKKTYTHLDTHAVYGMVFYRPSKQIVSGDEHQGLTFPHYLSPGSDGQLVHIVTHAPEGVDMTPTITSRDTLAQGSELLPNGAVTLSNGRLSVRPADFSTGAAVIDVVCPGLEIDGEVFETVIEVSVSDKPAAPVVLIRANGTVTNGRAQVEAVLKNGGEGVMLLLNDTELRGESMGGAYVFTGETKPGTYKNVRIRNSAGEGVVSAGMLVELVAGEAASEKRVEAVTKGKKASIAMIVIIVTVAGVVLILVAIALYVHYRSKKMDQAFIDGRVEHIARDVYGRGSVHV